MIGGPDLASQPPALPEPGGATRPHGEPSVLGSIENEGASPSKDYDPREEPRVRPSCVQQLKKAAKRLKHEVLALYYAMQDPRTPWMAHFIGFFVLAYALSPLDLIPDFIPVLGILDDLLLLPGMIMLAIWIIPKEVMEHARYRAEHQPMRLSRNWFTATSVFALWVACIELCVYYSINAWGNDEWKRYQIHIMVGVGVLGFIAFFIWLAISLNKEKRKIAKAEAKMAATDTTDVENGGLAQPLLPDSGSLS